MYSLKCRNVPVGVHVTSSGNHWHNHDKADTEYLFRSHKPEYAVGVKSLKLAACCYSVSAEERSSIV